jgi:predicted MFS family arabinose efflux permease
VPLATLGWRWVFWASVPFSLAAVVIGWLVIPQTADRGFASEGRCGRRSRATHRLV